MSGVLPAVPPLTALFLGIALAAVVGLALELRARLRDVGEREMVTEMMTEVLWRREAEVRGREADLAWAVIRRGAR